MKRSALPLVFVLAAFFVASPPGCATDDAGSDDDDQSMGGAAAGHPGGKAGAGGQSAGAGGTTSSKAGAGGSVGGAGGVVGGAGGAAGSAGAGGMAGNSAGGMSGGTGGTVANPDACPDKPQGKECDQPMCRYQIGDATGKCLCNGTLYVCPNLPAPEGAMDCPIDPQQKRCPAQNRFCRIDAKDFCICQAIGGSDLWSCQ